MPLPAPLAAAERLVDEGDGLLERVAVAEPLPLPLPATLPETGRPLDRELVAGAVVLPLDGVVEAVVSREREAAAEPLPARSPAIERDEVVAGAALVGPVADEGVVVEGEVGAAAPREAEPVTPPAPASAPWPPFAAPLASPATVPAAPFAAPWAEP